MALPDTKDPTTGVLGTLALVNSSQWTPRTSLKPKHDLFAPRLGLAYRLNNNLVVRAAYGINYLSPDLSASVLASSSPINKATTGWVNNGSTSIANFMYDPFPSGITQATGRSNFTTFMTKMLNRSVSGVVPTDKYSYQQQWNFGVAPQLKSQLMVEVGYTGATAKHLPSTQGLDELSSANIAYAQDQLQPGASSTRAQQPPKLPLPKTWQRFGQAPTSLGRAI